MHVIDYPHWDMKPQLKYYYLMQASFWSQQLFVLLLRLERPRKDYYELVCHHFVTIWLIGYPLQVLSHFLGVAHEAFQVELPRQSKLDRKRSLPEYGLSRYCSCSEYSTFSLSSGYRMTFPFVQGLQGPQLHAAQHRQDHRLLWPLSGVDILQDLPQLKYTVVRLVRI